MNRNRITVIALVGLLTSGVGAAQAGGSFESYNTTVGKFNGNGYTGFQRQARHGASSELRSSSVGGDYGVDARIEGPRDGGWKRVYDNSRVWLPNDNPAGSSVRVRFSNDLTTRVDVQVSGRWRSN